MNRYNRRERSKTPSLISAYFLQEDLSRSLVIVYTIFRVP